MSSLFTSAKLDSNKPILSSFSTQEEPRSLAAEKNRGDMNWSVYSIKNDMYKHIIFLNCLLMNVVISYQILPAGFGLHHDSSIGG